MGPLLANARLKLNFAQIVSLALLEYAQTQQKSVNMEIVVNSNTI